MPHLTPQNPLSNPRCCSHIFFAAATPPRSSRRCCCATTAQPTLELFGMHHVALAGRLCCWEDLAQGVLPQERQHNHCQGPHHKIHPQLHRDRHQAKAAAQQHTHTHKHKNTACVSHTDRTLPQQRGTQYMSRCVRGVSVHQPHSAPTGQRARGQRFFHSPTPATPASSPSQTATQLPSPVEERIELNRPRLQQNDSSEGTHTQNAPPGLTCR